MTVFEVIGVIIALVLFLAKILVPIIEEKDRDEKIQECRKALLDGDIPSVESRIDRVCSQAGESSSGFKSDKDISRELSTIYGVAVDGYSDSKNTGTSGKV